MTVPIELIILSLPDKLSSFILSSSLKNRHYETSRIFLDSEDDLLVKRLLYAVDWNFLKSYMFDRYGLSGNRRSIIDGFITSVKPNLVETIISIHEMYQNYDIANFLRRIVQVHKVVADRLLSEEVTTNCIDEEEEHYYDYGHNLRTKLQYYGYEPNYENPMDMAERLYGVPDPRLVED